MEMDMPQKLLRDVDAGDFINGKRVIVAEPTSGGRIRLEFSDGSVLPAADPKSKIWVDELSTEWSEAISY
jgi:hypothetical protein